MGDGSRIMTAEEAIATCDIYCRIVQDMKEQIIANAPPIDTGAFDILDDFGQGRQSFFGGVH